MRGAAAALAGAMLFFLGVLTAASDTDRITPPPAIPLGVDVAGDPAADPTRTSPEPANGTPAVEPSPEETPAAPAEDGTPARPETPAPPPGGDPARPGDAPADPSVPPAGEEPPPTGDSGGVEEVDGHLDCYEMGSDPDRSCPPGQAKKIEDPPGKGPG